MIPVKTFAKYAQDPAAFRDDLIVDVDGLAKRFGTVMDPWQKADFAALDPALMRCNGRTDSSRVSQVPEESAPPVPMRAYLERHVYEPKTWTEFLSLIGLDGLLEAANKGRSIYND